MVLTISSERDHTKCPENLLNVRKINSFAYLVNYIVLLLPKCVKKKFPPNHDHLICKIEKKKCFSQLRFLFVCCKPPWLLRLGGVKVQDELTWIRNSGHPGDGRKNNKSIIYRSILRALDG